MELLKQYSCKKWILRIEDNMLFVFCFNVEVAVPLDCIGGTLMFRGTPVTYD